MNAPITPDRAERLDPQPDVYRNAERSEDAVLSGHSYIAARFRNGDDERDDQRFKVRIAAAGRCGHQNRICEATHCWQSWDHDYVLLWDRTAGGRRLKRHIETAVHAK